MATKSLTVSATTRRLAKDRHALSRRLERREKWLEKAGITTALLLEAVQTLQAGMRAVKIIERGPRAGEEIPDEPTRIKAAAEIADFIRLTVGLSAAPPDVKAAPIQTAIVINLPEWMQPPTEKHPALPEKPARREPVPQEEVTEAEIENEEAVRP